MKKFAAADLPVVSGSRYPPPFDVPCRPRRSRRLGEAAGLTQFGVNLVQLPPGTWSSQRHWHSHEDELVYVLRGEAVLLTDSGEEILGPGDCVGFKGGVRDGHCLQNRSTRDVELLVVGSRLEEDCGEYSDVDMVFTGNRYAGGGGKFLRKDGRPY